MITAKNLHCQLHRPDHFWKVWLTTTPNNAANVPFRNMWSTGQKTEFNRQMYIIYYVTNHEVVSACWLVYTKIHKPKVVAMGGLNSGWNESFLKMFSPLLLHTPCLIFACYFSCCSSNNRTPGTGWNLSHWHYTLYYRCVLPCKKNIHLFYLGLLITGLDLLWHRLVLFLDLLLAYSMNLLVLKSKEKNWFKKQKI